MRQNISGSEIFFYQIERFSIFRGPVKRDIFFDNGDYVTDHVRKCFDKIVVEICKSYKCLDVSDAYKDLLILNSFNFFKVYADAFSRND